MTFDQQEFDIRCEWGDHGVAVLSPVSDAVVIVDVLSFSTSVDIAVNQGAIVFPYRRGRDDTASDYAASVGAELVDPDRNRTSYSLSPESLLSIRKGARLVLPSPNGATLTLAAKPTPVLTGCLRNAQAVALAASRYGRKIAVIPAGERWRTDHSLRPALEDLIGAGAIINYLAGRLSPEAMSAATIFREIKPGIGGYLRQCTSGKELIERGFVNDVILASQLNVSECAPVLIDDAYMRVETQE